ncbi:MAG: alpha/beta fold hydrolase [Bacteroidetes bacterium]|nr:MAG: alpha/beta fold hydrolase [Bacteroidota bacterium]
MKRLNVLICLTLGILSCISCARYHANTQKDKVEKTYVLVHGAYHGKWCWDKLIPRLEQFGHKAVAIDLPGMGADSTPISSITFADYVDAICDAIGQQPNKVILVGHSLGGISISAAAEKCTEQISSLVYITATVLRNGESLMNKSVEDPNPSEATFYRISDDNMYAEAIKEKAREAFYQDCKNKDVAFALTKLRPQPIKPITEAITISKGRYGTIPKYFIECANDRIFSLEYQRLLQGQFPFKKIYTIQTGHSPFLADPETLAEILNKID